MSCRAACRSTVRADGPSPLSPNVFTRTAPALSRRMCSPGRPQASLDERAGQNRRSQTCPPGGAQAALAKSAGASRRRQTCPARRPSPNLTALAERAGASRRCRTWLARRPSPNLTALDERAWASRPCRTCRGRPPSQNLPVPARIAEPAVPAAIAQLSPPSPNMFMRYFRNQTKWNTESATAWDGRTFWQGRPGPARRSNRPGQEADGHVG